MSTFKTKSGTELPLLDMRGKPYLQVAHRIVWFREEKPNWRIETELLVSDPGMTVARAVIKDESNTIISTAHKREDKAGFLDHMEKAETGAIGRALALIGYGTQFCADELSEGERLADSPMPTAKRPPQPAPPSALSRSINPDRTAPSRPAVRAVPSKPGPTATIEGALASFAKGPGRVDPVKQIPQADTSFNFGPFSEEGVP